MISSQTVAPVTTSWMWQYYEGLHYAIKGCLKVRVRLIQAMIKENAGYGCMPCGKPRYSTEL